MKLRFAYGNDALMLPCTVAQHMERATKRDIRILLLLAAEPMARVDLEAATARLEEQGIAKSDTAAAIAFWRGAGVILADESEESAVAAAPAQEKSAPRVIADGGLPSYSSEELSGVLQRRRELSALIDECQRIMGKIFNTREVGILAGLLDHLGFDGEYILLLVSHCVRMEKKSMRYMEKMALSLHDEGIFDVVELEQRLHRIEAFAKVEGRIRAMFGIAGRALTTKERGMLEKWVGTMGYGEDVITLAYEMTVDAIGKASIPYANTILERWYGEKYRTLQDVQAAIAEYKRKKQGGSSFAVDDFWEAAMKRMEKEYGLS